MRTKKYERYIFFLHRLTCYSLENIIDVIMEEYEFSMRKKTYTIQILFVCILLLISAYCRKKHTLPHRITTTTDPHVRRLCIQFNQTLKGK